MEGQSTALEEGLNKYLYNGKELQDDLGLDWYDYGARFYDAQLGRFHVVDNYSEKYYSLTPYQYVANSPINGIDVNGDYILIYSDNKDDDKNYLYENGKAYSYTMKNGKIVRGDEYTGKSKAVAQVVSDLNKISKNGMGRKFVSDLVSSTEETGITFDKNMKAGEMGFDYAYTKDIKYTTSNHYLDDGVFTDKSHFNLGHEIAHAWADQEARDYSLFEPGGEYKFESPGQKKVTKGTQWEKAEGFAVQFTNHLRASEGSTDMRYTYSGTQLFGRYYKFRGADYFLRNPLPDSYMHIRPLAKRLSTRTPKKHKPRIAK